MHTSFRRTLFVSLITATMACTHAGPSAGTPPGSGQTGPTNPALRDHAFLADLYADTYYPPHLLDACKAVFVDLCRAIETQRPQDLPALYALTHRATERLNDLQLAFEENGSEFETVAREAFGAEFEYIATAYGFADADVEELIAPREW